MAQLKQPLHPDDCAAFFLALVLSGEHLACLHVYFLKVSPAHWNRGFGDLVYIICPQTQE